MEPQTRFDLSAALQTWREELAAQPNLTAETRRELETHVNDTVAEMRQRGLSDEESFWLARRRVGQPKELGTEFAKAEPVSPGRGWVLWIALAFYAMSLWQSITESFWFVFIGTSSIGIAFLLNYLFVALLSVYVARSRSLAKFATWRSLIRSHGRLLVVCSFLAVRGFEFAILAHARGQIGLREWGSILSDPSGLIWPLTLVAIIVWLLPSEKSPALEHA